jgi:two-component system response regulator AlgR
MRVLIVDDEPLARDRLRRLVTGTLNHEAVGEAGNGEEALRLAEQLRPDVVLLDIRMPVMDGLETARHIQILEDPPAVVFCTAYDDHALEAFDASAVDYLMKPIRQERLAEALEKARRLSAGRLAELHAQVGDPPGRRHICARVRGNLQLIPIENIVYLLAEHKYVTVCHQDGEVLIEESLKALEKEFGNRFVRIHRNALVACDRLAGLEKDSADHALVRLRGSDRRLEVSRRNLAALRQIITRL